MPGSSNPFGAPNAFPHAPSTATNGYGRTTQVSLDALMNNGNSDY